MFKRSKFNLTVGGMMEPRLQVLPAEVTMAKQILARLGDYSAMTEEDDLISNTRALAGLLGSIGIFTSNAKP
jgi:hypothetical protein